MAEAFPEPRDVAARYNDNVDRAAALQMLAELLSQKAGSPSVPAVTEKVQRYRSAADELNPRGRGSMSVV